MAEIVSNHYIVHFKYLIILFVNYTSIKLEKNQIGCGAHGTLINCHWQHKLVQAL